MITDEGTLNSFADSDQRADGETSSFSIAGFWYRFLSSVIDVIVLAVPLIILGFVFSSIAFSLGPWGRLIGYGIIVLYWGYFSSEYGAGQTVGKRLMKTVVVGGDGAFLSVGRSMLRALVLAPILMLNGWSLPIFQNPIPRILQSIVAFGGGLVLFYGLVFNKVTRQGAHDLVAGSYVIKAPPPLGGTAPRMPTLHKRVILGLLGFAVVISLLGSGLAAGIAGLLLKDPPANLGGIDSGEWGEILELQETLSQSKECFSIDVQRTDHYQWGQSEAVKTLDITLWAKKPCRRNPEYCDNLVEDTARIVLDQYDGIDALSGMQITIVNRFDLGLAHGNVTSSTARSIEQWRQAIQSGTLQHG